MERAELERQAALAQRFLREIEAAIERLRRPVEAAQRRDIIERIPEIMISEMLTEMRVLHALHLQYVLELMHWPSQLQRTGGMVHPIVISGRVAAGLTQTIPTRIPD